MLSIERVSKQYNGRTVLRDVSLTLASGEVVLLAGANGAGKTTLLRLAAGLAQPHSGTIAWESDDIRIGYLGHAPSLYPGLSALDNLVFWQRLYRGDTGRKTLMAALEHVGLSRRANDRVATFSRGMAQRLNLARVLLQNPSLLLLDEPGTGLDADSMRLLSAEVTSARDKGAGVLWVSHQIEVDGMAADRIVLIADRQVAFDGTHPDYMRTYGTRSC